MKQILPYLNPFVWIGFIIGAIAGGFIFGLAAPMDWALDRINCR